MSVMGVLTAQMVLMSTIVNMCAVLVRKLLSPPALHPAILLTAHAPLCISSAPILGAASLLLNYVTALQIVRMGLMKQWLCVPIHYVN